MTSPTVRRPLSRLRLAVGLAAGLCCACAHPSPSTPPQVGASVDPLANAVATIRGEDLAAHVKVLASDSFEGRFPGTAAEAKTVAYISAHLARAGVEPALNGSYLQPVPLTSVTTLPDARVTLHGPGGPLKLQVPEDIIISSPTSQPTLVLEQRELVFAGHGIVAPEYGWNDYAEVDVRDKVVVVMPGDPGPTRNDPSFFEARTLTLYGTLTHKAEQAAQRGAAALLTLTEPETFGVSWAVLVKGARRPHHQLADPSGPAQVTAGGLLPTATLSKALGAEDSARLEHLRQAAITDGFRAQPLGLSVSLEVNRRVEPVMSHNVVGITWVGPLGVKAIPSLMVPLTMPPG